MTIINHDSWENNERGNRDAQRHREKIDDQIRKSVRDVIGEESIITRKDGKTVRIPVKGLKDFHFKNGISDATQKGGVGQGKAKPGDVIARQQGSGNTQGKKAGDERGEEYMEVEVDIDYLIQIMFEELGLPFLKDKLRAEQLVPSGWKFNSISKVGIPPRMNKKKTILETMKRTAGYISEIMEQTGCTQEDAERSLIQSEGDMELAIEIVLMNKVDLTINPDVLYIDDDDLRFKQIERDYEIHSNAVVIAMMDVSGCYSDDTEVLTKRGWVLFKDIKNDDDFATRNPETKKFEWQKSTDYIEYDYKGELYNFHSTYIDLLVTPNHRMLITKRKNNGTWEECILTAEELNEYSCSTKSANICIPTNSNWDGVGIETKTFGKYDISGDDYCALLGMYLSEGSLRRNSGSVVIAQYEKSKGFIPFKTLLDKICKDRMPVWYSGKQFEFKWNELCDYLSPIGTRIIPDDIMNATQEQIKIFWHYYWLGDGTKGKLKDDVTISTTSEIIRDQFLELTQKLGFQANYSTDNRDRIGQSSRPCYRITKYEGDKSSFNKEKIEYDGKVYCVSVPNSIIYVRRNGKTSWCGNSMTPEKKYLARSFLFWMVEFLRKSYDNVQIKFIVHTTEAELVDEDDFFKKGTWGGTKCHTAFDLANKLIDTEFPVDSWNVYGIYASDSEDFDMNATLTSINTMLKKDINMLAYLDIKTEKESVYSDDLFDKIVRRFSLKQTSKNSKSFRSIDAHIVASKITDRTDVYPALKEVLFQPIKK